MPQRVLITQMRWTEIGANNIKEEYVSWKNFRRLLINFGQKRVWK